MEEKMSFYDILYKIANENPRHEIANMEALEIMKDSGYEDFIKSLFEEILKEEVSLDNVEYVGSGVTSLVLKVNAPNGKGYVIKIGGEREHFEMPYSEYIIQPFVREQIPLKDGRFLTVEVQRETRVQREDDHIVTISGATVADLYNKLKEEGIKWNDPGTGQIGILEEDDDNSRRIGRGWGGYIDDGGLDENGMGRSSFVEEVEVKPGRPKYVVIDTDKLYRKGDTPKKPNRNSVMDR